MIYWPIQTLVNSGIDDILLVCGGNSAGEFLRVLGNGEAFGLKRLNYAYQAEPSGIADALGMAEEWASKEDICVILADNIFEQNVAASVERFKFSSAHACIFLTEVERPEWYGVVEVESSPTKMMKVKSITEKPKKPKSNLIATGLYMYKSTVWQMIYDLEPSARGELEITDLNNMFLNLGLLQAEKLKGWWGDAGESIDVYLQACIKAEAIERNRRSENGN